MTQTSKSWLLLVWILLLVFAGQTCVHLAAGHRLSDSLVYSLVSTAGVFVVLTLTARLFGRLEPMGTESLDRRERRQAVSASWGGPLPSDPRVLAAAASRARRLSTVRRRDAVMLAVVGAMFGLWVAALATLSSPWWWALLGVVLLTALTVAWIVRHYARRLVELEAAAPTG